MLTVAWRVEDKCSGDCSPPRRHRQLHVLGAYGPAGRDPETRLLAPRFSAWGVRTHWAQRTCPQGHTVSAAGQPGLRNPCRTMILPMALWTQLRGRPCGTQHRRLSVLPLGKASASLPGRQLSGTTRTDAAMMRAGTVDSIWSQPQLQRKRGGSPPQCPLPAAWGACPASGSPAAGR